MRYIRMGGEFLYYLFGSFIGNKRFRYKSCHKVLSGMAQACGLKMYNHSLYWFNDPEYLAMWKKFPETTNTITERRYNLYSFAKSVAGLEGDTVECGVLYGGGSHIILEAMSDTTHHIFDSFEGLSEPEKEDQIKTLTPYEWKKHDLSVPEERVRRNLNVFGDRVRYYKGWIPDRFAEVQDRRFKLVHIDVDLYQPTRDAIEFFYPRMVPGGMIICDDYGSLICPGAKQSFDEFMAGKPETVIHLTTSQGVIIKREAA